jgi:rfaE bifunctional protein kinase chain/domain
VFMNLEGILASIPKQRALVVGDICLDRWCTYEPSESEPSRETGIPRIAVVSTERTPGAGGTVANNLAALGTGRVSVLGILGEDGNGFELRQALTARGIEHDLCITHPDVCTFTYTKLLNAENGEEDRPRVDFINMQPMPDAAQREVASRLLSVAPEFDLILVSDQAETQVGGVVTEIVREALAQIGKQHPTKIVWVDSRRRPELFRNIIIKSNEEEAIAACRRLGISEDLEQLRCGMETRRLVVTHGSKGVLLLEDGGKKWVSTIPVAQPVDICGAGDSFSAGASLALHATGDLEQAARFGNLVASITIMKKGTGTASPSECRLAYAGWKQEPATDEHR